MSLESRPVVVGFDGSPDAVRALRWAVPFARGTGVPVRVVVARGDLYSVSDWADEWTRGLAQEWGDRARAVIAEVGADGVDLETEIEIVDDAPTKVVIEESARATAVVIGSRGHGALAGVVQGSVSQHVSRHATCPVVVVREAHDNESRRVVVGVDGSNSSLQALEFALRYSASTDSTLDVVYAPERWRGQTYQGPAELLPKIMTEFEATRALCCSASRRWPANSLTSLYASNAPTPEPRARTDRRFRSWGACGGRLPRPRRLGGLGPRLGECRGAAPRPLSRGCRPVELQLL